LFKSAVKERERERKEGGKGKGDKKKKKKSRAPFTRIYTRSEEERVLPRLKGRPKRDLIFVTT